MIGAIAGDIIGSVYEQAPTKTKDFPLFHPRCRFTDDSVLTIAIAKAILDGTDYRQAVLDIGRRYPDAGYGASFIDWLHSPTPQPYNSWGNGAAMRVSPVGFAFNSLGTIMQEAARTAAFSHDHPEGIKGAQATALAVFLARTERDKEAIRQAITELFGYNLDCTIEDIRPAYRFDVSCQGSVPQAIIAFLDSESYEDAIRNAVSLGGDSDTLACIAGGIAEAYYGAVAPLIRDETRKRLPEELWDITVQFCRQFGLEPAFPSENA